MALIFLIGTAGFSLSGYMINFNFNLAVFEGCIRWGRFCIPILLAAWYLNVFFCMERRMFK